MRGVMMIKNKIKLLVSADLFALSSVKYTDIVKQTGYVSINVGDDKFNKQLEDRINVIQRSIQISSAQDNIRKSKYLMDCYRNIRAVASGNVPDERIISIRTLPMRKIKNILHRLKGTSDVSEVELRKLKRLLPPTFEGSCEKIVYAAVIRNYISQATPKLLIIAEPYPDPFGVKLLKAKGLVPGFASEVIKLFHKSSVKRSLCLEPWGMTTRLIFSENFPIITTPEWEKLTNDVIASLHESKYFIGIVIDNLRYLSLNQSKKEMKIWSPSADTCLGIVNKSLASLAIRNECLELEVDNLRMLVRSEDFINNFYDLQVRLLKLSDSLDRQFASFFENKPPSAVDLNLDNWRKLSSFNNNLEHTQSSMNNDIEERKQNRIVLPCTIEDALKSYKDREMSGMDKEIVQNFQEKFGLPFTQMKAENILCITKFGSHLYNLDVPESDKDYFIIFRRPQNWTSRERCQEKYLSESDLHETDWQAVEVRLFAQMLYNSSPAICEIVFSSYSHEYLHPIMKILIENCSILLSERLLYSYRSYYSNMINLMNTKLLSTKNNKLLYQAFHKVNNYEDICKGMKPRVHIDGQERKFIMKLRMSVALSLNEIEQLMAIANERMRVADNSRRCLLQDFPDHDSIREWLRLVRIFSK